jgi:hypothetical protein
VDEKILDRESRINEKVGQFMTNYVVLDIEQVIYIHEQIISMAGGKQ